MSFVMTDEFSVRVLNGLVVKVLDSQSKSLLYLELLGDSKVDSAFHPF